MKNLLIILLIAVYFNLITTNLHAQTKSSNHYNITTTKSTLPLNEGDKCPEFSFNNIYNYSKTNSKLSNYAGKIVILNFWSTYCSSCISEFPKFQKLQDAFPNSIQIFLVADQKDAKFLVPNFWKKNAIAKSISLPCIIDEKMELSKYFPRDALGLQVIISQTGVVKAITDAEYINEITIAKLLRNEEVKMISKALKHFDKDAPMLKSNDNGYIKPKNLFYSSIFEFTPNISNKYETGHLTIDSIEQTKTIKFYNTGLGVLYLSSTRYHPFFKSKNRPGWKTIWDIKNKARFFYDSSYGYYNDWMEKNSFCYEAKVPISLSDSLFYEFMRMDLNRYFHLKDTIEFRNVTCFILSNKKQNDSNGNKLQNSKVEEILNILTLQTKQIILIEDVGLQLPQNDEELIKKEIYKSNSITEINKFLGHHNLKLVEANRIVDFLVIKDND